MEKFSKKHKMKRLHFILDHHMRFQSYLPTGLQLIIEKHTVYMYVMEYYLIMNRLDGVKLLLLEK